MTDPLKILPANIDDPRFQESSKPDRDREWAAGAALMATATEPINEAETIVGSPYGVVAFADGCVAALAEMISSLLGNLLSHWSPH
jgi:hypothetical protein